MAAAVPNFGAALIGLDADVRLCRQRLPGRGIGCPQAFVRRKVMTLYPYTSFKRVTVSITHVRCSLRLGTPGFCCHWLGEISLRISHSGRAPLFVELLSV